MSDRLRIKIVKTLEEETHLLTGSEFEQFGYRFMPLIEDGDWVERGTTIEGAPRGGTVDSSARSAAWVAEMSSEVDYFAGDLTKLRNDLKHAIDKHPQVQRIWLLSSRTAGAHTTTAAENAASAFRDEHPTVANVTILDARRIAEQLFELLGKKELARHLSAFLPGLARLEEEHAFSHSLPSADGLTPRPHLERTVLDALSSRPLVVLQGISGAGKTKLAARLAHELTGFDNRIWLDAREVRSIESLRSVPVTQSGTHHNLTNLLRQQRILLVLDDPQLPLEDLSKIETGGRSRILVTTQVASGEEVIRVADLEPAESRVVLTSGVSSPCPEEVAERVVRLIGGHALTLHALNRLAQRRGWIAVRDCLETESLNGLQDEHRQNIFRRMLARHSVDIARELEFVKWCGAPRFHLELTRVVSNVALDNLDDRGFLSSTTKGYARVHDLAYAAIVSDVVVSSQNDARFRRGLAALVRKESDGDRLLLERMARLQAPLLKRLLAAERDPMFLYMVALSRSGADSIELLGDPQREAVSLASHADLHTSTPEIRAVIEVVEALFTLRTDFRSDDDARAGLEHDIASLEALMASPALTSQQRRMLQHHWAKMLIKIGRKAEAAKRFAGLLEQDPSLASVSLQVAREVMPRDAAMATCRSILASYTSRPDSVSMNVALEALRLLALHGLDERDVEGLLATVRQAAALDLSIAARLVASVAQRAWLSAPSVVLRMFEAVEWHEFAPGPGEAFHWGQAHKYAALVMEQENARRARLLHDAVEFFKLAKPGREYELTHYAEALVLAGHHSCADAELEKVPAAKRGPFWWQRKAQALAGLSAHAEARAAMDRAIETLGDETLRSVFYADRYQLRRAAGDDGAAEDLEVAIAGLPEDHAYRGQLVKMRNADRQIDESRQRSPTGGE